MEKEVEKMRDYVKYAGVLFAITLVTALLLGVVNLFTAPVIEQNTAEKLTVAAEKVVEGKIDFDTATSHVVDEESSVREINSYQNDEGNTVYVVKSVPSGYAGDIEMMIGFTSEGLVTDIEIISMSETPGLGENAKGNKNWLSQFLGEGAEELDGITGATITSKAVKKGVDDARAQVMLIAGGGDVE